MLYCDSNSSEDFLANIIFSKTSAGLWLISLPSRSGKTTWCIKLVAQAWVLGMTLKRFICPKIFQDGMKIDIDLLSVASGKMRHLEIFTHDNGKTAFACSQIDKNLLAKRNKSIAGLYNGDIILIDEIGPLELEKRPALRSLTRKRWPSARLLNLKMVST